MKQMPIGDVVRMTGLSRSFIAMLDSELKPERTPAGHRRYALEDVQRFMAMRGQK